MASTAIAHASTRDPSCIVPPLCGEGDTPGAGAGEAPAGPPLLGEGLAPTGGAGLVPAGPAGPAPGVGLAGAGPGAGDRAFGWSCVFPTTISPGLSTTGPELVSVVVLVLLVGCAGAVGPG